MNTIIGFLVAVIKITAMSTAYFGSQHMEQGTYSTTFICCMGLLALSITFLKKED